MFWVSRHLNYTANLNITILGCIYDCKLTVLHAYVLASAIAVLIA